MRGLSPLLAALCGMGKVAADKPNIVFFMADDLGWNNVEWHNPTQMKTPNAMQLVKEGIELDRHYVFVYCSPSRSSLMTGRLPYHVQQQNYQNCDLGQGVHRNFTFMSAKLKGAGYETHHVGKWHLGMSERSRIPQGRKFDTSLVYFEGAQDHFTQRSCTDPQCLVPINDSTPVPPRLNFSVSPYDFWLNDGPAKGIAGSRYNGYQFNDFGVNAIMNHDPTKGPFFMYFAAANSHSPLEAPQRFLDMYPEDWYLDRRQYAAMCSFWDEILGNLTTALKTKNMWDNTLLVFSSDNGGPVYWSTTPSFPHGAGANNWPLKGGKVSNWEGGTRVAAFVSGGAVPEAMRGKKLTGYAHIADWYSTFCALAGVDPTDTQAAAAGLPPIDSLNLWPWLSGSVSESPRTEIPLSINYDMGHRAVGFNSSALIIGDMKLLVGVQLMSYHQGPAFPNASRYGVFTDPSLRKDCLIGCLYNISADPTEQQDIAIQHPEVVRNMRNRIDELSETSFETSSDKSQTDECVAKVKANGGYYGPWRP